MKTQFLNTKVILTIHHFENKDGNSTIIGRKSQSAKLESKEKKSIILCFKQMIFHLLILFTTLTRKRGGGKRKNYGHSLAH